MLKKWRAHIRAVTCLVFSEDDSLLVSGAEDGTVRVWSLFMYFSLPFSVLLSVAVVNFLLGYCKAWVLAAMLTIVAYAAFVVQDIR